MDLGLRKKNVLITGSTNGLGKAIAKIMAEEGANVIISGRNEIAAKQLAKEQTRCRLFRLLLIYLSKMQLSSYLK